MVRAFGVHHEWGKLGEAVIGNEPALADLLAREGVSVQRSAASAPRDALVIVGTHLVEASLRSEARAAERYALRPIAQAAAQRRGVAWSSVPPGWPNGVDGPFLEGGDVLLNGHEVYVGMSGRASDMAGIDWLERLLGSSYRVIPVAMRSTVRHLEDILALVRPGLLVHCPGLLIDGLPTSLRGWDAIAVSPEEVEQRVPHMLILEPGRVVIDAANERIAKELERRAIQSVRARFDGRLRAAHLPLWRESVLE